MIQTNTAYHDLSQGNGAYSQAVSIGPNTLNAQNFPINDSQTTAPGGIINIQGGATGFGAFGNPGSKNQINIVAKKRPPSMPLKNHLACGVDPKRKVLYRNFHNIDDTIYLVEISRNALKVFILLFPNFEAPDIFLCEIMAEKKA